MLAFDDGTSPAFRNSSSASLCALHLSACACRRNLASCVARSPHISPRAKAVSLPAHLHSLHPSPHACSTVHTCTNHVPLSPLPRSYVNAASYLSRQRINRQRGHLWCGPCTRTCSAQVSLTSPGHMTSFAHFAMTSGAALLDDESSPESVPAPFDSHGVGVPPLETNRGDASGSLVESGRCLRITRGLATGFVPTRIVATGFVPFVPTRIDEIKWLLLGGASTC